MKSRLSHYLFLCALIAATGCSRQPAAVPESVAKPSSVPSSELVLAQVNGEPITEAAFRQSWNEMQPAKDDDSTRRAVLDNLVDRRIMVERARALGLADDPVVRRAAESALIARLKELELQPRIAAIEVTEEEVRATYDAALGTRFTTGPQVQVAVLWFNSRGQDELVKRYRPRLESLLPTIKTTPVAEGFGKLAIGNSEHRASRYRGGILDWLEVDKTYQDSWRQAVLNLAATLQTPGELSAITATDEGLFVLRLIARKDSSTRPFEHVRATLRDQLIRERRQAAEASFGEESRDPVSVDRFDERLSEIKPLPVDAPDKPVQSAIFAVEAEK